MKTYKLSDNKRQLVGNLLVVQLKNIKNELLYTYENNQGETNETIND